MVLASSRLCYANDAQFYLLFIFAYAHTGILKYCMLKRKRDISLKILYNCKIMKYYLRVALNYCEGTRHNLPNSVSFFFFP